MASGISFISPLLKQKTPPELQAVFFLDNYSQLDLSVSDFG